MRAGSYRPFLDGLRALAVAAVIVYHLNAAWLPGGYLGVDIFFVLSGYLITGLLLAEHQDRGRIDLPAPWPADLAAFDRDILPSLAEVTAGAIAAAAGLSVGYCRKVKAGAARPHPMWWEATGELGDLLITSPADPFRG